MKYLLLNVLIGIFFGRTIEARNIIKIIDTKVNSVKPIYQYQAPQYSNNDAMKLDWSDGYKIKTRINFNFFDMNDYFYEESALKRSEIIFFLSIPFIFLTHVISLITIYFIATQDITLTKFPTETFFFAGASSLMIAGGIIYLDFKKNQGSLKNIQDDHKLHLRYHYSF